jgi:protoheme IX farnesyltransferase
MRNYIALTKPRVIELLLVTTVPTMILAQGGLPSLSLVALTLLGGSLAAGSANALNCVYDRDIDVVMYRTKNRPIATGEIRPGRGLVFGLVLGALSLTLFATLINLLSAVLALAAILFYVFVYTMGLKRRTAQNIVWGGAAGCIPVLIGWSAVTNSLTWTPFVLFGVIFLWTPPHYWPLSMRYRDDYDRAGVPMLSVVASPVEVGRQVVAYSWAMVACSLLLWPVAGAGLIYLGTAFVAGGGFLVEAPRRRGRAPRRWRPCGCSTCRSRISTCCSWRSPSTPSSTWRCPASEPVHTIRDQAIRGDRAISCSGGEGVLGLGDRDHPEPERFIGHPVGRCPGASSQRVP